MVIAVAIDDRGRCDRYHFYFSYIKPLIRWLFRDLKNPFRGLIICPT